MISDGSLMPLIERPIALGLVVVLALFVVVNVRPIRRVLGRVFLPSQA